MRKKFKKRLLGIILTILMVVSVIPVQQVQPVKAAGTLTLNKGDKIYFKVISRDNGTFGEANAVPAVYLKTSATDGSGTWQTMTEVPGESNIYQYEVDKDNVTYVAFRRMSEDGITYWDSMTSPLEIKGNMYTSEGWSNSIQTNSKPENWCNYPEGGETPDPTPSTSYTVYYKKSAKSNDKNWDNATNFYVYGFNSDTDKSDIQPMRLTSTAGVYEYTFTKQYAQVIFLRTTRFTSSGKDYSNQTVNLTVPWETTANPMFALDGESGENGKKKGTWSNNENASTGDEVLKERFYVSTNLVDYINDARLGENNSTSGYSNNNQGTVVSDSNVYSYLDAAISGSPWYDKHGITSSGCKYTYPLYFGNMANTGIRYGRRLDEKWFGLNNFSVGANVALEESGFYGAAAQGLVGNKLVNGKMVDPKNPSVVLPYFSGEAIHPYNTAGEIDENKNLSEYYNDLQFPFKQTMDKNGVITYSYDSGSDYAVYYDFDKKSFYESDQHIKNGTTNDSTAPTNGFYPLNEPTDSRDAVNMGFGTEFTIPFTLSKDGKINGKDITFKFTGDDDVWVFIDDYLVLDMGGAHRMASGTIDFTKKEVTVDRAFTPAPSTTDAFKQGDPRENQTSKKITKKFTEINTEGKNTFANIMANDSKVHTLKMFYMERGMIDSNMSVSFNFSPIPSGLTLSKDVDTTPVNEGLKSDVETKDNFDFTVVDNDPRTEYTYEKDYDGTGTERNTTKNGVVKGLADNVYAKNFEYKDADSKGNKGLQIGTDFTITETENPNYNTRWFVTDISTGDKKGEGNTLTSNFTLGNKDSGVTKVNYNVNFVNTPKVGTVNITKAWKGDVPKTLQKEDFPFKVEVDLDGAAEKDEYSTYALEYTVDGKDSYTTEADGSFKLKCGQKAAFKGIPIGATVKVTETKTTDDKSWIVSGPNVAESTPVTEGSNQTLTITNATKTITSNKVIYVEAGKDTLYTPAEVKTDYKVFDLSNGLTYTEKGFNGTESNKSYTANYTGSNSDGAIVNGTITVLTYQATDKVYVFDYGLESNIAETNANGDGLFQGGKFYNEEAKGDMATSAKLGTITYVPGNTQTPQTPQSTISGSDIAINSDGSAASAVTFKPVAFMDKAENYTYTANITKKGATLDPKNPETGTTVNGTIKTMPANVVYYEDNFANEVTVVDKDNVKIVNRTPIKLSQSNSQTELYGHDNAYADTENNDSAGSSTAMSVGAKATFTFKGTGFDLISRTSGTSGSIVYKVKNMGTNTVAKYGAVDTYYNNGDLYQLPVVSIKDLTYGTYEVTLLVPKSSMESASTFYLDGVRIYNPLNDEKEKNASYIKNEVSVKTTSIREMILGTCDITESGITDDSGSYITSAEVPGSTSSILYCADDASAMSFFGDVNQEDMNQGASVTYSSSLAEYLRRGPSNEVYLTGTTGIGFVVKPDETGNSTLQVEAKKVDMSTESEYTAAKDTTLSMVTTTADGYAKQEISAIDTKTAMYYNIPVENAIPLKDGSYLVVLTGTATKTQCISLSNLKQKGYTVSSPANTANQALVEGIIGPTIPADPTTYGVEVSFVKFIGNVQSGRKATAEVTVPKGSEVDGFQVYANGNPITTKMTPKGTENGKTTYYVTFNMTKARGTFTLDFVPYKYDKDGKTRIESELYLRKTVVVRR